MFSRQQPSTLTYEQVAQLVAQLVASAVRAEVAPVRETLSTIAPKVDILATDHVRREDLESVRKEMMEAIKTVNSSVYSREVSDARMKELIDRITSLETHDRRDEDVALQYRSIGWTRNGVIVAGIIGAIGLILTLIQALGHLSIHP